MNNLLKLVISVIISQFAGLVGSIFTTPAIPSWYAGLNKPSFSPPNWLFAPVWLSLYTLMGISFFLVWREGWEKKSVKRAMILFLVHLVLNSLWSILFFGLQNPLLAFLEIIVLWITIVLLIVLFWKINKTAAKLLIPYLFWVSFAAILNYSIFNLN